MDNPPRDPFPQSSPGDSPSSEGPSRAAAKIQDSAGEGAPQQSGMPQGGGGVASHAESEDEELELGTSTPYVQYAGGSHRGTIGDCWKKPPGALS